MRRLLLDRVSIAGLRLMHQDPRVKQIDIYWESVSQTDLNLGEDIGDGSVLPLIKVTATEPFKDFNLGQCVINYQLPWMKDQDNWYCFMLVGVELDSQQMIFQQFLKQINPDWLLVAGFLCHNIYRYTLSDISNDQVFDVWPINLKLKNQQWQYLDRQALVDVLTYFDNQIDDDVIDQYQHLINVGINYQLKDPLVFNDGTFLGSKLLRFRLFSTLSYDQGKITETRFKAPYDYDWDSQLPTDSYELLLFDPMDQLRNLKDNHQNLAFKNIKAYDPELYQRLKEMIN